MSANVATGLAITNPLVKYRALVATRTISPEPSQHRLALHLQKLYEQLKDYEPQVEYSQRLEQISRAVGSQHDAVDQGNQDVRPPIPKRTPWRSLLLAKESRDSLALTRRLTSHESALQMTSPRGLMLHGEVGTGKSMLVDLFAECLPTRKKRRWHFNTFMLEAFAKLEGLRRQRMSSLSQTLPAAHDEDHSLLWLAKDLVQTSPILFLDEFQLPDRAASKILTSLMTSFFHLGGVLIATSNRMPEELAKAAGVHYTPPPGRLASLAWGLGFARRSTCSDSGLFGGQNEFGAFLEVLKARCEVWEMEGGKDYRRLESRPTTSVVHHEEPSGWRLDGHDDLQSAPGMSGAEVPDAANVYEDMQPAVWPTWYFTDAELFNEAVKQAMSHNAKGDRTDWQAAVLKVYGRTISIPRTLNGACRWSFDELCKASLGPADYTSLASTYDTLILTNVPVMTWLMKNEARRFITLLDALYECKCKLLISAEAGPDDIFFPEKVNRPDEEGGDAVYPETLSEVYQDATAPFRPNILTQNPNYAEPDPEPDYTHARLAGLLNADALEDDPPNKPRRNPFGRSFGRTDSELERKPIDPDEPRYVSPNFAQTGAFTGEDERFAYKRAQSRLWEMCSGRWWARNEAGWHRPLPLEVRRWERAADHDVNTAVRRDPSVDLTTEAAMGEAVVDETRDERSFKQSASPFRTSNEPPPKIGWQHVWGTIKWGRRSGAWGQGVDGLKDRDKEKQ